MKLLLVVLFCCMPVSLLADDREEADAPDDTTKWYNRTQKLQEVTVSKKRERYRRKNNPAVELMRRVIAAKRRYRLEAHDYCSWQNYRKITFAANDIKPTSLLGGPFGTIPGIAGLIELNPWDSTKFMLPVTYNETVSEHLYRRRPKLERDITVAERSKGINEIFQTGEVLTAALKDFFTDVDIYDNQVRLLQHPFTSPISDDAIAFYRYFIIDTVKVEADSCIHLYFTPNNPRDFGFSGDLWVVKDSSWQVRRCRLTIPAKSEVNFVEAMHINQEFRRLPTGEWVLADDDMAVELSLFDFFQKGVVIRTTRRSAYSFAPIADSLFVGEAREVTLKDARKRDDTFWQQQRPEQLSGSEERMNGFVAGLENDRLYGKVLPVLRVIVEGYLETSMKRGRSRFDIGPVTSFVSSNFVDGLRLRFGGQTTANLSPHLFAAGYYARGEKSRRSYYDARLIWSLNRKEYLPDEYPIRAVTLEATSDICSPSDRLHEGDKDNLFASLKWTTADKMMFYRRYTMTLQREDYFGLRSTLSLKHEEDEAAGALLFRPMATGLDTRLNTTELTAELRFAPGEKLVNTKTRRRHLNRDAPVLTLSHTLGLKGFLGGDYACNFTRLSFFKRFWVKSWGKVDVDLSASAQWNKVPFMLLAMPAANLSYITGYGTFGLVNEMEFLNDRSVSCMVTWDLNGKIFNRLPLIKHLKWREYVGVRTLWGTLTDKNNPTLDANAADATLMAFPASSFIMNPHTPYVEVIAGVHNVFRFFHIEYVRRLNYLGLPTARRNGIRIKFTLKF